MFLKRGLNLKIIKENNISNVIIFSTMIIIMSLMFFNAYYFITKQYDILDRGIIQSKKAYVKFQKKLIQREVESVIDTIKFKRAQLTTRSSLEEKNRIKQEIIDWATNIRFGDTKENYVFIYAIKDFKGGDKFAKMVVNPNRPDLVGKYISDEYQDANGKKFRKIFLRDIDKQGFSFVNYMYKKLESSDVRPKVTYFKLYPHWKWVIGAGTYLDEMDVEIAQRKATLKRSMQIEITSAIIIFLFFSLVANAFAIFLGKQIEKYLNQYNAQVKEKTEQLQHFNKTLENKIHKEVQRSKEQEQLLIQKSKFIALGEMLSNIAHQWRQPLSQLSAIMMTLKFRYNLKKLDEDTMQSKSKEAEHLLEYMSKTINDFSEFFKPEKAEQEFFIKQTVDAALSIIGKSTQRKTIEIYQSIPENAKIFGYKNEFEQVILNIITNAKQILLEKSIEQPTITIKVKSDKTYTYITIQDNAGGIKVEPIEKIFEPYFTTKESTGGTGIGLYMSKLIIEKSMGGMLIAKNKKRGASFIIRVRKVD